MEKTKKGSMDFAQMFEASMTKMEKLKIGQAIETSIISISGNTVFLELSGKSEGILPIEELLNEEGKLTAQEGDTIKAYFLQYKHGEMLFTTKIGGQTASSSLLEEAYINGIPVEGLVAKEIKGGYDIKLGQTRAFCPFSQMGLRRDEGPSPVGTKLMFKILEYRDNGRSLLLSNRLILEEEAEEKREALKGRLSLGMSVTGRVSSIHEFGAFVEVDGFKALLPISEVSLERVEDLTKVLSEGQEITASIISLDWQNEKMSLSLKSLLPDPWLEAESKYSVDSKHEGSITRIADFGLFVRLEAGLEGLVHISEVRNHENPKNPLSAYKKGQKLAVVIKGLDSQEKRISLTLASTLAENAKIDAYLEKGDEGTSYSPFAKLLKK